MEVGSCVKCAETFSACGCGSKAAEDAPIPADPRVSPLNEGLYTPSDTPEMAAEEVPDFYMITFEIRDGDRESYYRTIVRPDIANLSDEELIISLTGDDEIYEEGYKDYWWVFGEQLWRVDSKKAMSSDTKKVFNDYGLYAESFGAESKFDKLAKEIAKEYEEKGKSPKEAMEIGEATAAKIGRAKFGKRKFAKMGQKAESFSAPIEGYWGQTVDSLIKDLEGFKMNYSGDMPVVVRDGIGWSGVGIYDVSFQEFQTTPDKLGGDEYDSDRDEIRQSEDKIDALAIVKAHNEPVHVSRYGAEDDIDFDELEYPCDICGKPSDYNFQDGTLRWEIKDDEFVGGKPKISEYAGDTQNDFYCKKHANLYESGSFYAEDDIDFDEAKADRNKDGRISDWERAVGNAVAKGIRDHKGAESAFDRLEDEVAEEYEEKGMSDKEAKRIGAAVAYEQGVKKYGKKIMSEAARKGVSARSLERRAEVGPHVPTRIGATTTPRGVVKTFDSIPAGDGHVIGQFTPDMDYAPSGVYGAESITDSIAKGFGSVLGIMSGLIIGGFAMNAVSKLSSDDEN